MLEGSDLADVVDVSEDSEDSEGSDARVRDLGGGLSFIFFSVLG